jgi:hypothetical protein
MSLANSKSANNPIRIESVCQSHRNDNYLCFVTLQRENDTF